MFPVYFILECSSSNGAHESGVSGTYGEERSSEPYDSNIHFYKRLLVGFQFQRFQEPVKHTCKIKVSNR